MTQTNDKLANLQETLEDRVQSARENLLQEVRVLQAAAAEIVADPNANIGAIVGLATRLRCRAIEIEHIALQAQASQEALRGLKAAIAAK